jgi:hypothetical protein
MAHTNTLLASAAAAGSGLGASIAHPNVEQRNARWQKCMMQPQFIFDFPEFLQEIAPIAPSNHHVDGAPHE